MSPLVKNVGLAFLAAVVTATAATLNAGVELNKAAITSAVGAIIYAGARAAVGYLKDYFTGSPFAVDTEAGE